jgi:VWFA-related protein
MARIAVFVVAAATGLVPQASPIPPARSVHVRVVDDKGQPVTDLQRADFEIRDNGQRRPVEGFAPHVPQRAVVVLLDVSGSMTGLADALMSGAESVLTGLPASDRVRLGTFSDRLQLGPVIRGSRLDALKSLVGGLQSDRWGALYDALLSTMEVIATDTERRVIILMTDGDDSRSKRTLNDVVQQAQALDMAVFALVFPRALPNVPKVDLYETRRLAAETGGGFVEWKGGDVSSAAGPLIGQLLSEYRLDFTPIELDGKRHRLEVIVKRKGTRVVAPRNFVAVKPPAPSP